MVVLIWLSRLPKLPGRQQLGVWRGHRPRRSTSRPARTRWMISGRLSSGTEKITEMGCIWVMTTRPVVLRGLDVVAWIDLAQPDLPVDRRDDVAIGQIELARRRPRPDRSAPCRCTAAPGSAGHPVAAARSNPAVRASGSASGRTAPVPAGPGRAPACPAPVPAPPE